MAIFHFTVKIVGRSKGKSVISASAYLNGDVMKNEETGRISYYTSKKEVVYTSLMMCENAPPEWLHVPEENIKRFQQSIRYKRADDKDAALEKFKITFQKQRLWNEVLKIEKNADAQLGRSFEFSLPKEWSIQEQIDYTTEYIQKTFVDKGITLSDFDADTPSGKNWDEHVSCGEIPLVVYEALEDYEENSQVTLYNDTENSTELYKYLMEYVRKNGWTEEDIFQLLNTSVFYYLDGRKKSTIIDFYQDSDDIIETIEMVYGYDFTDIEQNFMFYIDAHDETENFVNLKGISMMELPLLKVEEEIFRRNDQ